MADETAWNAAHLTNDFRHYNRIERGYWLLKVFYGYNRHL